MKSRSAAGLGSTEFSELDPAVELVLSALRGTSLMSETLRPDLLREHRLARLGAPLTAASCPRLLLLGGGLGMLVMLGSFAVHRCSARNRRSSGR